jgi:hypothetical protein
MPLGGTIRLGAVLIVCAALLAACGDDDTEVQAPPGTPIDASETSDTSASGTSTSSAAANDATLEDVVIQADDLGDGWEPNTAEGDGDTSVCDGRDPIGDADPVAEAHSAFQHGETGPIVSSDAWRFASPEEAGEFADALIAVFVECAEFIESDEVEDIVYRFDPITFDEVGDRSYATRLTASPSWGDIIVESVVFQVDDTVVQVANGGFAMADSPLSEPSEFTEVDSELTRTLVEAVAGRL